MKPNLGLTDEQRSGVAALLSKTLADEYVLYTKTRNYHWNVTGPHFNDLHKFFESQYDLLAASIDEIAENIRYFGEKAPATLADFARLTRLPEHPGAYPPANEMIANLLADHETIIRQLRTDIRAAEGHGAADAADFLTALLEQHDKMAWMLRALAE
ncbi:MAG: DNA starvation/stationary phase protection protein [Bryobacteraceae bacterium]